MGRLLQLATFIFGLALFGDAIACSFVPPSLEQILASKAIAIGKVVDEKITESRPWEEYYRGRSVTVTLVQPLKGSIRFPVRSAITCGSSYAPLGSRVVVIMVEPGQFGVVESTPSLERRLRKRLGLPANNSFKPKPLRGSA